MTKNNKRPREEPVFSGAFAHCCFIPAPGRFKFVSVHSAYSLWNGYTYRIIRLRFRGSRTFLNAIFSSVIAAIVLKYLIRQPLQLCWLRSSKKGNHFIQPLPLGHAAFIKKDYVFFSCLQNLI